MCQKYTNYKAELRKSMTSTNLKPGEAFRCTSHSFYKSRQKYSVHDCMNVHVRVIRFSSSAF